MTLSHYGSKAALLAGAALIALSACSQPAADSAATTTENSMNDTSAPAQDLIARALEISAPTPEQRPVEIEQLGRTRTDEFTWLRDDNWQEVMRDTSVLRQDIRDHLEAENAYYNEVMEPLTGLETRIYEEIRGRIKEDDESPASRDGEWYYSSRYREGGQYPVFVRRATGENGEMAGEEVIISVNVAQVLESMLELG